MVEQLHAKVDLIARESAEQTAAIASLKQGLEVLQLGRTYDAKEIAGLIARLTKEMDELTAWRHASYRQMWEGDDSIGARLKDLRRSMDDRREADEALEAEVAELKEDMERLRSQVPSLVEESISRREFSFDGKIRLERTRGFWALVVGVAVALASAAGLVLKQMTAQ